MSKQQSLLLLSVPLACCHLGIFLQALLALHFPTCGRAVFFAFRYYQSLELSLSGKEKPDFSVQKGRLPENVQTRGALIFKI